MNAYCFLLFTVRYSIAQLKNEWKLMANVKA